MDKTEILKWWANNWYWLLPIIISELLPFLPTRANGIAQAVVNILKRLNAGTALALLLVVLSLGGCTTMNNTINLPPAATGGNYSIQISADKNVPVTVANPEVTATPSGNTVTGIPGL